MKDFLKFYLFLSVDQCAVKVLKRELRNVRICNATEKGLRTRRVGEMGEMALPCRASVG
jgi:hypothetical protein